MRKWNLSPTTKNSQHDNADPGDDEQRNEASAALKCAESGSEGNVLRSFIAVFGIGKCSNKAEDECEGEDDDDGNGHGNMGGRL